MSYSGDLWEGLHDAVATLPPADVAGLLADCWALAFTTDLPISHFLRFADAVVDHSFPERPTFATAAAWPAHESSEQGPHPAPAPAPVPTSAPVPAPVPSPAPMPAAVSPPLPAPAVPKPAAAAPQTASDANQPSAPLFARARGNPQHDAPAHAPSPTGPLQAGKDRHALLGPNAADSNRPLGPHSRASPPLKHPAAPARQLVSATRSSRRLAESTSSTSALPPRGEFGVWEGLQNLQQLFTLVEAAGLDEEERFSCSAALAQWTSVQILGPAATAVGLSLGAGGGAPLTVTVGAAEPWELRLTRAAIAQLHAVLGPSRGVAEVAARVVPAYLAGEGPLHADVRGAMFAVAVRTDDPEGRGIVQLLRAHLQSSTDPAEQQRALRALAYDSDVRAAFEFVQTGQVRMPPPCIAYRPGLLPPTSTAAARGQDAADVAAGQVRGVCEVQVRAADVPRYIQWVSKVSQARRGEVWAYCQEHQEALKALLGGAPQAQELAVLRLLGKVASGFASEERAEEVEAFFRGAFGLELPQFVMEAIDEIRANAAARDQVVPGACDWLQVFGRRDYEYDYQVRSGGTDEITEALLYGSDYGDGLERDYMWGAATPAGSRAV